MSEAVSALNGAVFDGIARIEEAGLTGMITLRGDLASAGLKKALKAATGLGVPGQREVRQGDGKTVAWMSPDELLLVVPYADVAATIAAFTGGMGDAHVLAVDVSDARAVFKLSGARGREVLAKLAPVDLSPSAFASGQIRRSRLAQVAAAFWMDGDDSLTVVCFRSVAEYVFGILSVAAQAGSEVDAY